MRRLTRAAAGAALLALCAGIVYAATQLWHTTVPGGLQLPALDVTHEFAARPLHRAESFATFVEVTFLLSQVVLLVVLYIYARRGARLMAKSAAGPVGTGFLLAMLGLGIVWLAQLPFDVAELWWGRRHHVIHTGYLSSLLSDWLGLGTRFLFVCAALLVAMGIARLLRRTWWVPVGLVFAGFTLLFAFVTPWLLTGLEEPRPALARDAHAIAAREGVSGVPLRIARVSEVTSTPNAFSAGLGASRRVVLFDTVASFPRREVRFTIAHEYAHQARHHILKEVGWFLLLVLPAGLIVALATRRRGGLARPEAVPIALLVVAVLQLAAMPLRATVSRRYEAEADWVALNTTRDPAAMIGLFRHFTSVGLADPDPPGWFQVLFEDHPSGLQRIGMARAWAAREGVPIQ